MTIYIYNIPQARVCARYLLDKLDLLSYIRGETITMSPILCLLI